MFFSIVDKELLVEDLGMVFLNFFIVGINFYLVINYLFKNISFKIKVVSSLIFPLLFFYFTSWEGILISYEIFSLLLISLIYVLLIFFEIIIYKNKKSILKK